MGNENIVFFVFIEDPVQIPVTICLLAPETTCELSVKVRNIGPGALYEN